ncbi:hypothetical protein N7520_005876 [Penicillium odoratum]|uniref:uncharacterized protein n=1 Tax=Penicillium odoratum TaxID=1167516 RepID=UPI00254970AF|nr:uncharacterized protein N7520_005876 [Penicillium odoratum]KAJ5758720.1 hypothetical protein N7520_005876 [Penicillium odoratum]
MPITKRRRVLFLALGVKIEYTDMYDDLICKIKQKTILQETNIALMAIEDLESPLHAVFVNSEVLTQTCYIPTWNAVINYVQKGGTAICIGDFSNTKECLESRPVRNPFSAAGLLWKFDEKHHATVYLNREYIPLSESRVEALPQSYDTHAVFLRNVDTKDAWYRPTEVDITNLDVVEAGHVNPFSFSVAMTEVGDGKLGYVGDIGPGTPISVIMAMTGLD